MNKYAHFGHVLHFSGLAYGRHRVQGVEMGRLQPELAFQQIVSQTLRYMQDLPLLFCEPHFFENNKNAHISKTAGFRALILCSIDSAGPILGGSPHMHFSPTPSPFELSAIYGLEARGGKGS